MIYTGYCHWCEHSVIAPKVFCCESCERKYWKVMNCPLWGNLMTTLQKMLEEEENIVFYNQESFLDTLACCKYNDTMSLTSISFSSERVHFVYVLHSGKHVADSCKIVDYLKWKGTL